MDISINVNADSLNDVLDRITASGAGVTASFNETTQRVSLVSNDPSNQLVLNSGGTGFFSAVEISDGTYNPTQGFWKRGVFPQAAEQIADAVQDVADKRVAGSLDDARVLP